jgi:hypothetical protein
MARKSSPRLPRTPNPSIIAKLHSAILASAEAIERLDHANDIHVRRMAAMQVELGQLQAEIGRLRARYSATVLPFAPSEQAPLRRVLRD